MKLLNSDNPLNPAVYAADLAKTIAAEQAKMENLPDWWQQVVAQLHTQLDKQFPPFEVEFEELPSAGVIPPWKGRPDKHCPVCSEPEDKPHAPDCEYAVLDYLHLPGMENSRLNAMDWRLNGIEERIGTLEAHSLPYRVDTLEMFLDFDPQAPASDVSPDCIHDLIAEGMTGVTTHCMESAAALVTVLGNAADNRIDAVVKQAELLQSLVLNVKELLLNVDARLDALESKTPC